MKYGLENIVEACKNAKIPSDNLDKIIQYLGEIAEEEKNEDKAPRKKHIFNLLLGGQEGTEGFEGYGWLVKTEEGFDQAEIIPALRKAGAEFNETKKGQKAPVTTIPQVIGNVPQKTLKDYGINVLTKDPCLAVNLKGQESTEVNVS